MKKTTIKVLWMTFMLILPMTVSAEVTQNDRLLQRPELDGAIVQKNWLETEFRFENWDFDGGDAEVWTFGPTFISPVLSNQFIELGGRFDIINFDPDGFESETGASDIDVWGKYQVFKSEDTMISVGLLMTLPTGSEKILHPRASGEVNGEIFSGGRYQISPSLTAIAHVGLRHNSDMDVEVGNRETEVDGELQAKLGGGVIYEATQKLNLQGELNYATEAYEDFDDDVRLSVGADYEITPVFLLRGGSSFGLDDGAPDWGMTFGGLFQF